MISEDSSESEIWDFWWFLMISKDSWESEIWDFWSQILRTSAQSLRVSGQRISAQSLSSELQAQTQLRSSAQTVSESLSLESLGSESLSSKPRSDHQFKPQLRVSLRASAQRGSPNLISEPQPRALLVPPLRESQLRESQCRVPALRASAQSLNSEFPLRELQLRYFWDFQRKESA